MVGFFDLVTPTSPDFSADNDNALTSISSLYSIPDGTNPIASNMTPGGGAFTLGQWGNMFQVRADTAQNQEWQSDDGNVEQLNNTQTAQMLPPSTIFTKPPVEVVKPPVELFKPQTSTVEPPLEPPLPNYPTDPTKPPAPGWEWRGGEGSQPGDTRGAWKSPNQGESLHPDTEHGPPEGPHHDYNPPTGSTKYPNRNGYRWYPNGRMEPKSILPEDYV